MLLLVGLLLADIVFVGCLLGVLLPLLPDTEPEGLIP